MIVVPIHAEFVRIRTGIFEPKHVEKLGGGSPWVLYFWLHSQARFSGPGAGVLVEPYTHKRAADELGLNENSVKGWFQTLREGEYITTRQLRRGLEVTIANYRPGPAKGEPHSAPMPTKGEPQGYPTDDKGEPHTTKGEPHTTKGEPHSAPIGDSIKERAPNKSPRDSRESSPPPSPPRDGPTWQTGIVEAFVGRGLPAPDLDGNEGINARRLLKENDPALLAMCWQDIACGEYGDDWLLRNLSFVTLANSNRFTNWLMAKAGKTTPPSKRRANGRANPHEIQERLYQRDLEQHQRKALASGPD